ncbi:DNA excision repair protein ERCC-6-like, partial [Pocillopora damicornis]|uniref:DNA excision repair protein ERCC-6-like n=1 Tax=Pocillopora damicornis TaxID=46731 RepID=UPI000F556AA2
MISEMEANYNEELNATKELLKGLSIHQETTHEAEEEKQYRPSISDHSDDNEEDKLRYNRFIQKGKELGRQGHLERALQLFEKACAIFESEKLLRRIEKIKEAIERYKQEEDEEDEEDDGMCEVGDGFSLPAEIYQSLYPYQLDGVLWFWNLYQKGMGGILGDDMGSEKLVLYQDHYRQPITSSVLITCLMDDEMWALFDFACEGKLLGTSRTFKKEYEDPIVRARERDATTYEKRMGMEMSESLRKLIEPYFLRRTKAMVLEKKNKNPDEVDGSEESDKENKEGSIRRMPKELTRKNDFVVWLYMSESQIKIYSDFLGLERVKELLMSTRSPLAELNVLKKICDHPRLLSTLACEQLGLDEQARLVEMDADEDDSRSFATQPKGLGPSDKVLTQESGKMVFLVSLLDNLKAEGHRCLVFSQSRKMLDIVQRVITHRGHKVIRIDGTITSTAERQHLINTFQTDPSYTCFLLTTQVGGVGITLTSADRVVIFDPSWNPASDAQAVDRVYRIGQKKTVVIYRLITCGTLEEKIYRKQIFKDALMKQTTGLSKNPFRYFSHQELRDLFTLEDPHHSKTQLQLDQMHSKHRKTDNELEKHIKFLHTLNIFGISDHDLMYSHEDVETADEHSVPDREAIQARVLRAQNLVAAESGFSGQTRPSTLYPPSGVPSTCPRKIPDNQERMVIPQGLRHSLPSSENTMTARQKIQAKIDSEVFIIPKRDDTKRFQPSQASRSAQNSSPVLIDLCSPAAPKESSPPPEIINDSPAVLKKN